MFAQADIKKRLHRNPNGLRYNRYNFLDFHLFHCDRKSLAQRSSENGADTGFNESVDSDECSGKSHNICRAELLLELNDYRCVVEQQKQCSGEQNRVEQGTCDACNKILHEACLIFRRYCFENNCRQPAHENSGHDADDRSAQGTDAEKRNAESAHSEALDEARYSEYRAEKQSADRAEQNGSDDDRNRYKSYLDGSGFEITERCECHDDYQSGEQCGEHETHEFLPRCGS